MYGCMHISIWTFAYMYVHIYVCRQTCMYVHAYTLHIWRHTYNNDWLTIRNDYISFCAVCVYEFKCHCLAQLWRNIVRGIGGIGGSWVFIWNRRWGLSSVSVTNDSTSSAVFNIDECSLFQGMQHHSVLGTRFQPLHRDTNRCNRLLDVVPILLPWVALVPMILYKDSMLNFAKFSSQKDIKCVSKLILRPVIQLSDSFRFLYLLWGMLHFNNGIWHIKSICQKERNPVVLSEL